MAGIEVEASAFRSRLVAAGLGEFADALVGLARPGIQLVPDLAAPGHHRASRLGGVPDLPSSVAWPRKAGVPLSFIAQVDLADVAPHDADGPLPRDGLLSFFYEAITQEAWGFDPADRGSAAVLYTGAGTEVQRREPPADLAPEGVFAAVGLQPRGELTFAPWESSDVEQLDLSADHGSAYAELLGDYDGVIHRLLGHPIPVQNDMQRECQLVTHGLFRGDPSGQPGPDDPAGATEWRLLLQVDSQDEAGMMWGDVGRIYYWIRQQDLVARRWESTWLILQCC